MQKGMPGAGLHYPDLSIKGFRAIKDLSISQLGRVTLITGKNNTGKSSILEALRLHTYNAAPYVIYSILAFREENIGWADEEERPADPESLFQVSALFHGFPGLSEKFEPIVISTSARGHLLKLTMRLDWFTEERDPDGHRRLNPRQKSLFGESVDIAALVVETEEREQIHTLENFLRFARLTRGPRTRPSDRARMPCILVNPYGGEGTDMLGHLWDEIALTDDEKDVVAALRIIDKRISAVSMVGGEIRSRGRTAIVRAKNIPRPIPLRSFGDGLNRLFTIVLSLVNARGGILLIDEFENGLHYSVQSDAWRMIFRLAQSLDVQVFATSHSWDAVETFQKAAAETPEVGTLLRLSRRGDDIIPTVFSENELAIATRARIEVR
jgi:predicted ATPase